MEGGEEALFESFLVGTFVEPEIGFHQDCRLLKEIVEGCAFGRSITRVGAGIGTGYIFVPAVEHGG